MRNWTPATIQGKADTIQDIAKQIDAQLWYAERHGVHQIEAFNRDLKQKARDLQIAIQEFKALDTDAIIGELRGALR